MSSLFENNQNISSKKFKVMYDKENSMAIEARKFCERLWISYERYADTHFLNEIRLDGKFEDRFWEMHLGNVLIEKGFTISSADKGPDFKIDLDGQTVWIEAITASNGQLNLPDSLSPFPETTEAVLIDDNKVALRLRNAIESKSKKIEEYLQKKIINDDEPIIIAINTSKIDVILAQKFIDYADMVFFGKSFSYLETKDGTFQQVTKPKIYKTNGGEVSVDVFLNSDYSHISGVLLSKSNFSHYDQVILNSDYVLIINPNTQNKISSNLFKISNKMLLHKSDILFKNLNLDEML